MACLEELQQDVKDILLLLRNQDFCCGDNITYYDQTTYITIIVPGDGDDPDFYGETAVADWDEWLEYLCYNANLWVDELVRAAETIENALITGGLSIGLIAAIMSAIAFFVVGGVLALPLLMVVVFALGAEVSSAIFVNAAIDIEDARDEIICALLSGRSVSAAVEDALSSGTAWDLLYSHLDYDSATSILYEGGDGDAVFLESEKDDTCDCLCPHLSSEYPVTNPIIYQSAAGAQFQMTPHDVFGWTDHFYGHFTFNKIIGDGYCGGQKQIDTITVSDGLDFTYIKTKDAASVPIEEWGPAGDWACDYDITLLETEEMQKFLLMRVKPADGGCATTGITVTLTYHDV
jgi:hypothetical protein